MALRLVKTRLPVDSHDEVLRELEEADILQSWATRVGDSSFDVEYLVESEATEALVDALESRFGIAGDFRIVIQEVEGTVPRPEEDDEDEEGSEESSATEGTAPLSIEELYNDVTSGMAIDWTYTTMVVLSTIVAAVGLVRDDVAMVIAAMIIAPLLKPNISLCLATTLADGDLARESALVNGVGLAVAGGIAVVFGAIVPFDPSVDQIALRTQFGLLEFLLAGSAGTAGAMSFVTGEADNVVGVMVAVALLPPAVVAGMLVGAGRFQGAAGAALLTVANLVCLNLAGVVTFLVQHVRPRNAWESERANRAAKIAIAIWVVLLAILVALILFAGDFRRYP